jgi:hypothetical protein
MTEGEVLQNIAIEVVNMDDFLAETAVRTAVTTLATYIPLDLSTLTVEPHDDIRGVWARVVLTNDEKMTGEYSKLIIAALKSLIGLTVLNVKSPAIQIFITEKDEK